MPDTHQKILKIVGMSYQQFLSIAYMTHRIGSQFLRGSNKEKMDILSGIAGIGEWDKILGKCRGEKKILNSKIANLEKKVSYETGAVQTLQEQLQNNKAFDWEGHIKSLEATLGTCRSNWAAVQAQIKEINKDIQDLQNVRDESYNKDRVDSINAEISILNNSLRSSENSLSRPFYPQECPNLKKAFQAVSTELGQLQGELRATLGNSGSILEMTVCPTCESKITKTKKDKIEKKIKDLQGSVIDLEVKHAKIQLDLEKDKKSQQEADQANKLEIQKEINSIREQVQEKYSSIQQEQANYTKYEGELQVLRNRLPSLQVELNKLHSQGSQINSQIDQAKASIDNIKILEGQIFERQRQVQFFEGEIKEVKADLYIYIWLIDNIPYIKLHKMSRVMAEISELCNKYFDEMGDSIRINIKSFEEKAKKKHAADIKDLMKSEVKVDITDGAKHISPKLYSDGEISKISLAVIRALHELARKSGQGCNLMLMDEIFSFVDVGNSQKIANSLANFLNKGTVFLTDNSGSVNNLINFDQVWVARKKNGQTMLEIDQ
jgi:DNA repair exonuclease SbcCD ATPase subunit